MNYVIQVTEGKMQPRKHRLRQIADSRSAIADVSSQIQIMH